MRELSINEITRLEHNECIPSIRGTIKKVFDRRSGTNERGAWSIQGAVLIQGRDEIELRVDNHEDIKHLEGKDAVIFCWKSDKGLSGVYAFDDVYKGATKRKVRVTKSGTIADANAAGAPASDGGNKEHAPQNKTPSAGNQTASQASSQHELNELSARKIIAQFANLDILCRKAVEYVEEQLAEVGITMTDEQRQSRWASYFIQAAQYEKLHRAMPTGLMSLKPKKSADPEPVENVQVEDTQPEPDEEDPF